MTVGNDEEREDRGFKVHDRRRFSESGETREDESAAETHAAAAEPESAAEPEQPAAAAPERQHEHQHEHDHQHEHEHGAPVEMSFATFVLSLSTQALAALGEIPDPATGSTAPDLVAARQLIDILSILQEKTRGNLDADEAALLEHALYDLRMKFVERAPKS